MYNLVMAGKATPIIFSEQERNELEVWVRKPTMERRSADRARIVLEAATGKTTLEIAHSLKLSRSTVSKWRTRFAHQRMDGLMDKPRGGAKVKYGEDMERRILKQLGYQVFPAESGLRALEIYHRERDRIDLVILDMLMPGMGGAETFQKLKEIDPGVRVLLSSGYSLDGEAQQVMAAVAAANVPNMMFSTVEKED